MRTSDLLALALGNVGRARIRSTLTILGVAIGTALVVLLIALASGAEENVKKSIFSIGDLRLVTVQPFQPGSTGLSAVSRTITDDNVAKLRLIPHVDGVYRQFDAPLGTLLEGGEDAAIRPQGIEPNAPLDRGDLLAGRHLAPSERAVAVVPGNLARLIAPTAFMIPISRVRSSTAMIIVFAIPIAATSSATPPMPARIPRNTPKPWSI